MFGRLGGPHPRRRYAVKMGLVPTVLHIGARRLLLVSALLIGLFGCSRLAVAQGSTVGSESICAQCRIALGDTVRLTGIPAGSDNRLVRGMVRDPKSGVIFALMVGVADAVYVFDAEGRFVETYEPTGTSSHSYFTRIEMDPAGHLQVMDRTSNVRMILNSRTGDVVDRLSVEGAMSVWDVTFGPSKYVTSGPVATQSTAGFPLHVYDERGDWQLSFGVADPAYRGDLMPLLVRWLASADSFSFWAAPANEYRLERWTFDGQRLVELVGEREWFNPWGASNCCNVAGPSAGDKCRRAEVRQVWSPVDSVEHTCAAMERST